MVYNVNNHIKSLNFNYRMQLTSNEIKYYNKLAELVDKNTIKLTGYNGESEQVTAKYILIAVGGRP